MTLIEYYNVLANSDTTEGRGYSYPLVSFKEKKDAEAYANMPEVYQKHGVMGTKSLTVEKVSIMVYDNLADQKTHNIHAMKKRALAKLTKEEIAILGLDND